MPTEATANRLRKLLVPEYERDVRTLVGGRHVWKTVHDTVEIVSKVVAGVASILAFAASSVKNSQLTDILSFSAGCTGTLALVMTVFANYSRNQSRERTKELNTVLKFIGVTPMPQLIGSGEDVNEDVEFTQTHTTSNV